MVKKRVMEEKKEKNIIPANYGEMKMERILIENFVSLQKVMTNLAVKFDNLSGQISKLLELFEISAKTLAEKGSLSEDKKITDKLDSLIEQNKVIARGIALIHEREPEQYPYSSQAQTSQYPAQQPGNINGMEGYQRSLPPDFPKNQNPRR
jgi:hypothetical protein